MRSLRAYLGIFLFVVLVAGVSASSLALASSAPAAAPVAPQFGGFQPQAAAEREATGDPVTDALRPLNWRSIGPANMSGRIAAVLGVPGDPKVFWVGGADGGVWKTTNGGTTFEAVFEDYKAYSVGALALAGSDHNVVWLGSGEGDPRNSVGYGNGVYRSTDGGNSWTHLGLDDTNLLRGLEALRGMAPPPDNLILLVDGLPTQGRREPRRSTISGEDRLKLFDEAFGMLRPNIPVNVILFPMEGDPMAASAYWKRVIASGGAFLSPSEDWP